MCAIPQLVSTPLNPIPIVEHFFIICCKIVLVEHNGRLSWKYEYMKRAGLGGST